MEVPLVGSDQVKWARVIVLAQLTLSEPCCSVSPDMAGTAASPSHSRPLYIWRIHSSSPAVLELFGLDNSEASMFGLQLVFEESLSRYVAINVEQVISAHEGFVNVYAITASGVLYVLRIGAFYKFRGVSTLARSDVVQISLLNELGCLGQISAVSGAGYDVCIGGESGSILCYLGTNLNADTKEPHFELKDSDAILGRLWGLVARSKNAGPIKSLQVQTYKSQTLLFALHEDGAFKLWNLHNRARLLNLNLYKGELSGFVPKRMWVQDQKVGNRSTKVAFLFRKNEVNIHDAVHIYDLQIDPIGGAGSQPSMYLQIQTRVIEGTVLDIKLLSDRFWKLYLERGQYNLNCCSTKREELLECCELVEDDLRNQLFQWPDDDWDELDQFLDNLSSGSKTELQLPIADFFISRLLQLGIYQKDTLRKVLQNYKRNIPDSDFAFMTRDGMQREILAATETENVRGDKVVDLMHWKRFCQQYFVAWKQNNMPYSLLSDHQTGAIGLIRRNGVSFRRSLASFEKLCKGGYFEDEFLDALFRCTSTLRRCAGRLPSSVLGQILLGNKRTSVSHLVTAFVQFLDGGHVQYGTGNLTSNIGIDIERRKTLEYRQRHRKLELQFALEVQHLRNIAGGWSPLVDKIETFVLKFTKEMMLSNEGSLADLNCSINRRLVLKSAAQLSWNVFELARDLLVLLSFVVTMKGQVGISNNETLRIQKNLIMQVKKILLRGLLIHWLTSNFVEGFPPEDFSLHLSTLHLDNTTTNKSDGGDQLQDVTLAEILLSSRVKILPHLKFKGILSSDDLLDASVLLTSWLMWGENNSENESLSNRSVTLAAILLQHSQYAAVQDFLRIVENFCYEIESHVSKVSKVDWCARLHLLGCGLLGTTQKDVTGSANKSRVEKAVHYFFRAASLVGEESEDLSSFSFKIGMETSFTADETLKSWKFHYYEWVMQIFEQNHQLEGACQFAHAALQEANAKVHPTSTEDRNESLNSVLAIKGRLWANIFKFSLDTRNYKEAYCAIMSNPDSEGKHVCLRRFLIVLCQQKELEVLCGWELPYTGMLQRVEQELLTKAQHSDVKANPNPFKLLYSFHMHRNNWRRAALCMYVYAARIKEMSLAEAGLPVRSVLHEQLNSVGAVINALHLVEPMHAWVDLDSSFPGAISSQSSSKRMRIHANNDAGYALQKRRASYVDIRDLEREYTLILAKVCLIEADVQLNFQGDLTPENAVLSLAQAGLYEMAFTVLFKFWENSSLKSGLERVFKIIAEKWCVRQQHKLPEQQLLSHELLPGCGTKLLLLTSSDEDMISETEGGHETVTSDQGVNIVVNDALQTYLERYTKLHPELLVVVAETLLNIDRLIELPRWLVDMMKGGKKQTEIGMATAGANPSALFRLYLDFGRLTEAAMLFVEYVKAHSNLSPVEVIKRKRMCGVWFPFTLVDRLRTCLFELNRAEEMQSIQKLLEGTLSVYFDQVRIDSSDVKSLVQS